MITSTPTPALLLVLYAAVLLVACWTDLRDRRIPNLLTIPALVVALALAAWYGSLPSALLGASLGAGAFVVPMFIYGVSSAGGGDVKLAAFVGAALGFPDLLSALFLAGLSGSAVVLFGLAARRISRKSPVPFGPFIAFGGLAVLLTG